MNAIEEIGGVESVTVSETSGFHEPERYYEAEIAVRPDFTEEQARAVVATAALEGRCR